MAEQEGQQSEFPQPPKPENELGLYVDVRKFPSEETSGRAYREAQQAIFKDPNNELSVFRFQYGPREHLVWHVLVLGDPPLPVLTQKLQTILASGEKTSLPGEVVQSLAHRRAQANRVAPWVEGHYRHPKKSKK